MFLLMWRKKKERERKKETLARAQGSFRSFEDVEAALFVVPACR